MHYSANRKLHPSSARGIGPRRKVLLISLAMIALGGSVIVAASRHAIGSVIERAVARTLSDQSTGGRDERARFAEREVAQKADQLAGASFRISQVSAAGADRDAAAPDIAYNPEGNEYMVVWEGNGLSGANLRNVREIFGQRINAATGAEVGSDFRISNMSDGGTDRSAGRPQIVYNSTAHEYMVVWQGMGNMSAPSEVSEIYGQRLSRTGTEIGKDFRISNATDLGKVNTNFVRSSTNPDVVWNSVNNQYLVVWSGMGEPENVVKLEIYGQLLTSDGEEIGKDFRISNTTDQGANFNAGSPKVAYNSKNNQYLVVWAGGFKKDIQIEIWGQGLTDKGGAFGDGNGDFRISQVTANAGDDRDAGAPQVAYSSSNNEYMVVFHSGRSSGDGGPSNSAGDIFGQRIDAAKLVETGPNDFRISNAADAAMEADQPRVAYNSLEKEYLVVWRGVRANAPSEVFGQRLSLAGIEIETDFQVSNIAGVGKDRSVNNASVACNGTSGEYLTVWQGDGLPGATTRRVNEIFGQRIKPPTARRP